MSSNNTISNLTPNPFGEDGQVATDVLWIMISTFIIFTMQSGFGLLESGLVSRKSEANVMVKNTLDVVLGGITYWFVGYGLSFGPNTRDSNAMSGAGQFLTSVSLDEAEVYAKYFFQLSFATTATTIVSGAVAERVQLSSYMIFAALNTGLIYVFPAHWVWDSNGWLFKIGAYDFAGSSVVHMAGGAAAFVATIILGPRHGKFDEECKLTYAMASPTNVVLGTFFLWWGWIGFNCGSTFALSGGAWRVASRVGVVTINGAMAGGLSAIILGFAMYPRTMYLVDIPHFVSGILGGLVAITAPASVITTWEALIIGFIGGWIANGVIYLLEWLKIDDPVGCVGVHWAAGVWAMISVGLFAQRTPGVLDVDGIFRGGDGKLLGHNMLACLTISLWAGGLTAIIFLVMKYTIGIRMSIEHELRGSDEVEHNIIEDLSTSSIPEAKMQRKHNLGKRIASYPKYRKTEERSIPAGNYTNPNLELGTVNEY